MREGPVGIRHAVRILALLDRVAAIVRRIHQLARQPRGRAETTMAARLSGELMDAANNRGNAVKKREDAHRLADAHRAFSHYPG